MLLKEIGLDLDFNHKNYVALFNKDYDYDNSLEIYSKDWKDIRFEFSLEIRCMASMISRLMKKAHYGNFKKICFNCLLYDDFYIKQCEGFLNVGMQFDYIKFNSLSNYDKKVYTVNYILNGIIKIEKELKIDMSGIKDAIECVKQNNYRNEWVWKSKKKKTETISVYVFHDIPFAKVYMRHEKGSDFISEQIVKYVLPDEWFYHMFLGQLIKNGNEVSLIDKNGNVLLTESFCE